MNSLIVWVILWVIITGFIVDVPLMAGFGIGMAISRMLIWIVKRFFDLWR